MKIYLDIIHPATFHFFRNFIGIMVRQGHDFFISVKDKDVNLALLDHYKINYLNRGKAANSLMGKALNIIMTDIKLYGRVRKFAPDIVISFSSPVAAHLAFLLNVPCITLEDTECAGMVQKSYLPFSQVVLTPSCFSKKLGRKQLYFNSYKELAYLYPRYFTPSPNIHALLGIRSDERYILMRFVSRSALHDVGEAGMTDLFKFELVERISAQVRVFITSEISLPQELEPYRITIPAEEMHSTLSGASLLIGESATMAAEAAMLGVPAIFIDNQGRGYTDELENRYNLIHIFKPTQEGLSMAMNKAIELLHMPDREAVFQLLSEKIDPTAFMVWFVENYPESVKIMKDNPDYQNRFKTIC